ncbi:MAG: cysteine hydrolase family protein [Meiothermus sp.]|nr:cysteine hydrolase family protein [Meiothermus sp.]
MNQTALLIIDAQLGMFSGRPIHQAEETLGVISSLIAQARAARTPVVYIQDDDVGGYGTPEWEVHPALDPRPGDVRIRKQAADSFVDSDLQAELEVRSIEHLVITGFQTPFCVDVTSRRAAYLGYAVTLVADGHSASDQGALSGRQVVEYHNQLLDGMIGPDHGFGKLRGIEVRPSAEIKF